MLIPSPECQAGLYSWWQLAHPDSPMTPAPNEPRPKASRSRCSLALAAALTLLSSCSLIVEALESDGDASPESVIDGGTETGDARTFDANPKAQCGPTLDNTLAHYSFEGEAGLEEMGNSEAEFTAKFSHLKDPDSFEPGVLTVATGPEGCGEAAQLVTLNESIIVVGDESLPTAQSVDFWLFLDSENAGMDRAGVLSKDSNTVHNGDLELALLPAQTAADGSHLVMRMQRETPDPGEYFQCSEVLAFGVWHHIAVSNDISGAEFFVNGLSANATPDLNSIFAGDSCNQDSANAKQTIAANNMSDWFFGATASLSPNPLARLFLAGRIDEIRFRSVPFTLEDATLVYNGGRGVVPP